MQIIAAAEVGYIIGESTVGKTQLFVKQKDAQEATLRVPKSSKKFVMTIDLT
jgi:hypothetical protein